MLHWSKKSISGVIAVSLLACSLGVSAQDQAALPAYIEKLELKSVRHTQVEDYKKVSQTLKTSGYKKMLEDESIALYIKEKNASYRIVDKKSGYIWGGLSEEKPDDMNKTWSDIGNSVVLLEVIDKKGKEKSTGIGKAKTKYEVNGNTLTAKVDYKEYELKFEYTLTLVDGKLEFEFDTSKIEETGKTVLQSVSPFPFLGSTRGNEVPGYMFIPDGVGALVRFDAPTQYLVGFEKRIYGKDYAIDNLQQINDLGASRPNDFLVGEEQIYMPVYGVVHGVDQNGFVGYVTEGQEYMSIMATPAGVKTNYNWLTTKMIIRQKYLRPTSRNGAGVQVPQKDPNQFKAKIAYEFLQKDEANYVGMAKAYRTYLEECGVLVKEERLDENIPLQLDFIMSDVKKGFLKNTTEGITKIKEVKDVVTNLSDKGIDNLTVVLKGWQKGGLNGHQLDETKVERKIGSEKELNELNNQLKQLDGRLFYYENPLEVTEKQADLRKEIGHTLSQTIIQLDLENNTLLYPMRYYTKSPYAIENMNSKLNYYTKSPLENIAIDGMSYLLYADLQREKEVQRSQIMQEYVELMGRYDQELTVGMYTPNEYLLPYCSEYFNMPLNNSQYQFESDTVPFMPIILKGSIDYYAPYGNEGFYSQYDLLKMIEYGTYPSFILTGKPNYELANTASNQLFSTYYEEWEQHILDAYGFINEALRQVEGKKVVDREVLAEGIVKVTYEEGVSIYVNYTQDIYQEGTIKVTGQSYFVEGGVYEK